MIAPAEFMLGDAEVRWEIPHGYAYRFMHIARQQADNFLIFIPLPERHRYRLTTVMPPDPTISGNFAAVERGIVADRPAPTLADLQTGVDRLGPTGAMFHDLHWSSIFRISHRIVPQYRVGGVFTTGDAAHIHSPLRAGGVCTRGTHSRTPCNDGRATLHWQRIMSWSTWRV